MDASVIIVGAGPTGLMLAGELRLAGIDVIVLERLCERTGESRGIGFTVRTMEVFDQRGLLRRFGDFQTTTGGHFGGLPLDIGILGNVHEAARTVPQSETERVLEGWAVQLGVDIRRGYELVGLTDDRTGVAVNVRSDGGEQVLRASYLVGCDGGRSTVRRAAGFDFPGTAATTELFLADLRGVELEPRMSGQQFAGGMVMVARLSDGIHRIIVGERGAPPQRRTAPPAFEEVADTWKRLTGLDISHAEPVWVSAFGDATHLVTEYQRGRVLLAGDAAHVHLPAGGQGMNTGVQDAVNLGWKLAAVVDGTAPESLLDTYHSERHEVGRRLLANTRAQGQLILGGAEVQPLRDVLSELIGYEEVSRHLAAKVSGLDIRYDVGDGANPLLGMRMPHLDLIAGIRRTSSTELLRRGRGLLLDLNDNAVLRSRASRWRRRVDIVTATAPTVAQHPTLAGTTAVLVRPDGHIAWLAPGSHHDLPTALDRWFGHAR
ncbi:FAD-dependent monooxygenase [Plantactinospora sp. KLBMP9567]|uniref:FAD-dependent monooxygenase n=1 Tax=Plantactinospora sp. KLBMP9567 TaxID=3085900 RepID=UPI0029826777|nr:FAD-dependent monooxygenase [Plantactinospora sp. KLBMP9567]MDW5329502.1 FAD-dependent monooxygenase [Plantactinospora sp. KLBMP9567]